MRLRSLLAAVPIALVLAPSAQAAGWQRVTAPDGANSDQVGLLRTPDGTLHVAWRHDNGSLEDLLHTTIGPGGKLGATTPIVTGWANVQNPALVSVPGGIRAFWGALRSTDTNDPIDTIATALSPNGGASWALHPTGVVSDEAQAYGSPTAAAVLPNGTPLQTWYGTLGVWVHAGLAPTPGSNHDLQGPLGSYGYNANIAVGADGQPVVAWFSNATNHLGVHAQGVTAGGAPLGSPLNMPGTSNMQVGQSGRIPIAARAGGGVYVATGAGYPSLNRVRVWRVGAPSSTVVGKASGGASATVAADADGRVWVAWEDDRGADPRVYARRSNRSATAWGATVDVGRPKGAAGAYHLDASAIGSSLDVLTSFALGSGSPLATYHRRVRPGLTLKAKPGAVRRGKDVKVTFRVLDAGDPMKGARVRAGGDSGRTNRKGRVTLTVHAGRKAEARATAPGYTGAVRKLKVRR
jgi:hypothetical protein